MIKELLNWYRWILACVGFKMYSQTRAFLQSTCDNIHQYQFNKSTVCIYRKGDSAPVISIRFLFIIKMAHFTKGYTFYELTSEYGD